MQKIQPKLWLGYPVLLDVVKYLLLLLINYLFDLSSFDIFLCIVFYYLVITGIKCK